MIQPCMHKRSQENGNKFFRPRYYRAAGWHEWEKLWHPLIWIWKPLVNYPPIPVIAPQISKSIRLQMSLAKRVASTHQQIARQLQYSRQKNRHVTNPTCRRSEKSFNCFVAMSSRIPIKASNVACIQRVVTRTSSYYNEQSLHTNLQGFILDWLFQHITRISYETHCTIKVTCTFLALILQNSLQSVWITFGKFKSLYNFLQGKCMPSIQVLYL